VFFGCALALAGGCAPPEGDRMDEDKVAALEERMRGWPSVEDTEQQVVGAVRRIAEAAAAIVPELQWQETGERSTGSCKGEFLKTDGRDVHTATLLARLPIPDEAWPQVLAEARRIAAEIGVTEIEVRVDQPGRHDVRLYNDTWTEIYLGHLGNTTIDANTGCRLQQKDLAPAPNE
jgi:hypothetical protein